jgi:pimeloyl-ACP methyl ester carboxylesterase
MKRKSSFFGQILLAVTVMIIVALTSFVIDQNLQLSNSISASSQVGSNNNNGSTLPHSNSEFFSFDKAVLKKVNVGDIEIAYKTFGRGAPILLISGSGNVMDVWPSHFLNELAKGHKVTIFDNRGVGNTTEGTKPFSVKQFANDTLGLMNVLGIQKADVLGFSMGSFVAQQLILTYPEKVDRLILYGASCGGQEGIPQNPKVISVLSDFVNNRTKDASAFLEVTFPLKWIKENPNFLELIPKTSEDILSSTVKKQFEINENWLSTNWSGVCDLLQEVTKPSLIITGTEDEAIPSENSLILVDKIPGSWLVQIENAGHGLMYQYPEIFTEIVETFLNVTGTTR